MEGVEVRRRGASWLVGLKTNGYWTDARIDGRRG